MAYNRPINNVECLPIVSVGDSLCDGSGEPIINKAFKTLNGLQNIGYSAIYLNGSSTNGGIYRPIVGNNGTLFNEVSLMEYSKGSFVFFPGSTHYELVYRAKCAYRSGTSTEQFIEISIDIGGFSIVLDYVSPLGTGSARAIGTSEQVLGITGALPVSLPTFGPSILGKVYIKSTKSNPQTGIIPSTSGYWDGFMDLNLRFYNNCGI